MKQASTKFISSWVKLRVTAAACVVALTIVLTNALGAANEPSAERLSIVVPADIGFDVWMDDKPLGTHHYHFSQQGERLRVDSKARFNVKVLFVNVFSYDHLAVELWKGQCLSAVRSDTTTNSEEESLELEFDAEECPGTYSYWDKARLQRAELTNAQTGETEPAKWSDLESTPLPKPSKKAAIANPPAGITHHQLTTPAATFLLWYDNAGRCLSMQTTNDGRTITYINRQLL